MTGKRAAEESPRQAFKKNFVGPWQINIPMGPGLKKFLSEAPAEASSSEQLDIDAESIEESQDRGTDHRSNHMFRHY
jgi:hypothetical protein